MRMRSFDLCFIILCFNKNIKTKLLIIIEAEFKEFEPQHKFETGFKFETRLKIWLVPLKIVFNVSRFKPAHN